MARFTRCEGAAGVTYLHFETMGPTVPCPVPGWFDGGPMGWASVFSRLLAGGCRRARRGSLIGHHRGKSTLNVLDGLGEVLIWGYITVQRTANGLGDSFFGFN